MKLAPLLCSLLLFASSASAEPGVTEIRLGAPAPTAAPIDKAKVKAVERFLAARQTGSNDRDLASRARALLRTKERLEDAALFGPKGSTLAAFDFHDEAIEPASAGRFRVSVFLLFANAVGQVVESRDEELTLVKSGDSYVCGVLRVTNLIVWSQEDVLEAARSLGAAKELDEAQRHVRESAAAKTARVAYSFADVQKNADGRIVVQCLQFKSDPGRRGFEVTTAPIVLSRSDDSIRVESN
jgi:hypothetical protein